MLSWPASEIGGQLNMAKIVPGKEEFREMLRYFARRLETTAVRVNLEMRVAAVDLIRERYGVVIVATGVRPREPAIAGSAHPKVLSYIDVLRHRKPVGDKVA